MKTTIVAAVDKRTPETVIATGGALAARLDARLVLVHVQGDPPLLTGSVADRERARNGLNRAAIELLRRAGAKLPAEIDVAYRSELGPVVHRLCRVAEKTDALLLVTGVRNRGVLARTLLGSVSHGLARRSPCPVLIVPEPSDRQLSRDDVGPADAHATIVVGIDGSAAAAAAAAFADELASAFGDDLLLVHGLDAPGGSTPAGDSDDVYLPAVLRDPLARGHGYARYVVERGPAAHVLPEVAAREHARLIVIGSEEHRGFRQLSATPEVVQLPRRARRPVLVVRGAHASGRQPPREPALAVAA